MSYLVTYVYDNYAALPGAATVLATVLFAVQIYCDFSGYSDIAIGAAQVMGFSLMENFRRPYLATSVQDFWRRWHVSLSTWFRDYLYIPLGGNRKGIVRKYFNLMVTFLTSGLWHGADWSFVVWGGLNGAYQVIGGILAPVREKLCGALHIDKKRLFWRCIRVVFTFCLIDFAWLFFRADSFGMALSMIVHTVQNFNFSGITGDALYTLGLVQPDFTVMLWSIGALVLSDLLRERFGSLRERLTAMPLPIRWVVYLAGILLVLTFGIYGPGYSETQFIYFAF